jgi:hypothetical protein
VHAVEIAINKPRRWRESLAEAIEVTKQFWDLAGAKIDGPGRGNWKQITARLDSNDPLQLQLINLIKRLVAPPFPVAFRKRIYSAAKKLVARLP